MLLLSAIASALAFTLLLFGTRTVWHNRSPRWGWAALYAAIGLAFTARTAYVFTPQATISLAVEEVGLALMLAAALVSVSAAVSLRRARPRWTRAALTIASRATLSLLVFAGGYYVYVQPRVRRDGWWAGAPTFILARMVPTLPREALASRPHDNNAWSLAARIERSEVNALELAQIRTGMEKRFRRYPSEDNWRIACDLLSCDARLDDVGAIYFEHALKTFLETSDPREREASAGRIHPFLPLTGKSAFNHVGAAAGPPLASPRVPRILELTHDPSGQVQAVAIDLLAVCGDEAGPAIPRLLEIAREEDAWPGRFSVQEVLNYLADQSLLVRSRLIALARAPDTLDAVLAIESLCQWNRPNHSNADSIDLLTSLANGSGVRALAASLSLPNHEPPAALMRSIDAELQQASPDRAEIIRLLRSPTPWSVALLPRFFDAASDPSLQVRRQALEAVYDHLDWNELTAAAIRVHSATWDQLASDPDPATRELAGAISRKLEELAAAHAP